MRAKVNILRLISMNMFGRGLLAMREEVRREELRGVKKCVPSVSVALQPFGRSAGKHTSLTMASLMNANLPSEDEEDDSYDPSADKDKGEREDRVIPAASKRVSKRGWVAEGGQATYTYALEPTSSPPCCRPHAQSHFSPIAMQARASDR